MMKWQPIETAPQEGFFLVCQWPHSDFDVSVSVVWWNAKGDGLSTYIDDMERPYLDGPATHWMPLPEPPEQNGTET